VTGQTLGSYQILESLGEGGMGEVYKARDTRLNRMVAIKLLRGEQVADAGRKQRFIQEAQAASALNHPNIVVIHEICNENGVDYIVMESVEGKTLRALIPLQGMRQSEALRIGVQIASALTKAPAVGIIHRDLKPSNVMVSTDGRTTAYMSPEQVEGRRNAQVTFTSIGRDLCLKRSVNFWRN
jgi:serine/threonine-protein kinase